MAAIASPRQFEHLPARPTRPNAPHLRLVPPRSRAAGVYRRRRLFALLLAATVVAVLALAFVGARVLLSGPSVPPAERPASPSSPAPAVDRVHVVQPGDTLWTVARALDPDGDVRDTVDRLAARHGDGPLRVGERLVLDG